MGTKYSSELTRNLADKIANEIGSTHFSGNIDSILQSFEEIAMTFLQTDKKPKFKSQGGNNQEDLALQNIQARQRMVLSYALSQLGPWKQDKEGWLLVCGTGNLDEGLRGYMTKYDCSSGDLNPIGGICKLDLREFLKWGATTLKYPSLIEIYHAIPKAELTPHEQMQTDEQDMGMSYEELQHFGKLRQIERCGPVSMYNRLRTIWDHLDPQSTGAKVKHFFTTYGANRHKMTVVTPSYHAESYGNDDNRFDHRQIVYPNWNWQFGIVDKLAGIEKNEK